MVKRGRSFTRAIFTRLESPGQRDFLQTLPDLLLQGWALGWPAALPVVSSEQAMSL